MSFLITESAGGSIKALLYLTDNKPTIKCLHKTLCLLNKVPMPKL